VNEARWTFPETGEVELSLLEDATKQRTDNRDWHHCSLSDSDL
jgi:hypothetical protein